MKKRTLFWQFFGAHVLILLAAITFVAVYTEFKNREVFHRQWVSELETQAKLMGTLLPNTSTGAVDEGAVKQWFARLGHAEAHRFTLIFPNGQVIGDSEADPSGMDLHNDRPEVREAMANGRGMSERFSVSVGKQMLYVAQRVPQNGPIQAIVRVSVPVRKLTHELEASDRLLGVLLLVVLGAALALSYGAALRIVGPVSELQSGLLRIGGGDLSYRLPIPPVPHLAELARSINQTADRLQTDIQALNEERNLRTLILANMTRGVIAIDAHHAIMDLNDATRRLLRLTRPAPEGARIGEVMRYPELLSLIEESEKQGDPVEREMMVGDVIVNLRATALNDVAGCRVGTLVVLSDVTLLRKLETVRQDFVANVSHELRTPITSVKGFAETLLDGAMNDSETAERFLKIIVRQANQLETIIRDLLDLSRLEQSSSQNLELQMRPLAGILKSAIELCQSRAVERGVVLSLVCEEDLTAVVHTGLIEQAVVNLIDNAIKYGATGEQSRVDVVAKRTGTCVCIAIRDYGNGIEQKHLERLFERFYRVDKGRSRDLGGTGLGLAIIKHIVLIHKGTVDVESEIGKGSTFTIRLPA